MRIELKDVLEEDEAADMLIIKGDCHAHSKGDRCYQGVDKGGLGHPLRRTRATYEGESCGLKRVLPVGKEGIIGSCQIVI